MDASTLTAIVDERLGRLPLTQGLNEVRRPARPLQSSGKPNAKGVPTVACGFCRAQAVKEQRRKVRRKEVVGLRRRERSGVFSREEGNQLTHNGLNGKGQLEVSERVCRVAQHINVGKSNGPVAPDLTCGIALALAQGGLAPVSHQKSLKLLWRGEPGRNTPNHPQERGMCEPRRMLLLASTQRA
eukprot:6172840-Pleurochrysis_carterae.AAC.5